MSDWRKTNKSAPCVICGKAGWCTVSADGTTAKCMRIGEGAFKVEEDGSGLAHYHRIGDNTDYRDVKLPPKSPKRDARPVDWMAVCDDAEQRVGEQRIAALGSELGLSAASLKRIGVGWWARHNGLALRSSVPADLQRGWTFPMRDASNKPVGVRLRLIDPDAIAEYGNNKIALPGSAGDGIFIPRDLGHSGKRLLLICEGPTDCAALLDMGFDAIGRPSNTSGTRSIQLYVADNTHRYGWREVVILIDRDKPGTDAARNTWQGARTLAEALVSPRRSVRICQPPIGIKDAREWLRLGADEDDVMGVIDAAEAMTVGRYDLFKKQESAA